MADPIQILLTVVVTTLTVLLVIIGIQVFLVLQEAKKTLKRANKILDSLEVVVDSVIKPIKEASNFFSGIRKGADVIKVIAKFFKEEDEE
jgi:preprotein translocase subunit YajC